MIVAGGVYLEACVSPARFILLGSGGRAALTLAGETKDVQLHTFQPDVLVADLVANFEPMGVRVVSYENGGRISFEYLHPLSRPRTYPGPPRIRRTIAVAGKQVLRFGCLEGDFRVEADGAVYDPQGGSASESFSANGSAAERLALVMNAQELRRSACRDDLQEAADVLMKSEGASVAVAKDGPDGAHVFALNESRRHVPAYPTSSVYKIGSGDVFSAIFASAWLLQGRDPADAADLASRRTADYVEAPSFPLRRTDTGREPTRTENAPRRILLLGGSRTTSERWLHHEAAEALRSLGQIVLLHEGERHLPGSDAAEGSFDVILLIVGRSRDLTANLQTAYAYRRPVVAFVDDPRIPGPVRTSDTALSGDLCSAVHLACWMPL